MLRPRSLVALAAASLVAAVAATPASAAIGFSDCHSPASAPVFSPWWDATDYFLAPDGGFENGADGWALDDASVVSGNESYAVSGAGASALALGAGDSATSPAVCVGLEHPTFRFFVKRTGGSPLSSLGVSVVLPDGTALPVGAVTGSSTWQPSPVLLVGANLLPLVTGGYSTDVEFRFTPNSGTWQVDDVYVDPRGSR
jgi:hypothetical protein